MGWLLAGIAIGMVIGMVIAWGAEYFLDWRYRPRDGSLDAEAIHALQTALKRTHADLAQARAELAALEQREKERGNRT